MTPRREHEKYYKRFIERINDELGDHLDLDIEPLGPSTWRKKEADRGTEADTCYYIANAKLIIGKSEIDLTVDPPSDLAVEIDRANDSFAKFPIYSALRVPEIWRYDVRHMRVHMYELRLALKIGNAVFGEIKAPIQRNSSCAQCAEIALICGFRIRAICEICGS